MLRELGFYLFQEEEEMASNKFYTRNTKAARLTPTQVQEIRAKYATGNYTQGALCQEYDISIVQIGRIVRGESWKGMPIPATEYQMMQTALKLQRLSEDKSSGLLDLLEEGKKKEEVGPVVSPVVLRMKEELLGLPPSLLEGGETADETTGGVDRLKKEVAETKKADVYLDELTGEKK